MEHTSILFIGWYPNSVEKYKNVFFQNLIFAMADLGVECVVISPVSYMRYGNKIKMIPLQEWQATPKGNSVKVYYPRVFSASSKQLGSFNTEIISEKWFEKGAIKLAAKLNQKDNMRFDAVYGHFFLYGGLAAIKIGRLLHIPSYVAFGECDYETQVQKTYGDLKASDIEGLSGVIAVSSKNADTLKNLGIFNKIPIIVEPNAVDHRLFNKKEKILCRKKLGLPENKFIVGFVGGFIERKGDKRLMAAIDEIEDVYAAFAGVGEEPPAGKKVLFCKPLSHEEIPVFLNAMDIFCLPTLSEGSCNAVIEALSCGIPVISSDLSFNDDVLTGSNSIRIDPNSIHQIKESIQKLKADNNLRKILGQKGYETSKTLSIDMRAKRILTFIKEPSNES